jgi:SH3-like domain-containing protein
MKRTVLSLALAAAAVMASTTVTLAVNAVVTRDSPIYERRTGNSVIDEIDAGEEVEVTECRSNRCRIYYYDEEERGWIRQNRLAPLDDDGDVVRGVPFRFGVTIGSDGKPGLSIGIGN